MHLQSFHRIAAAMTAALCPLVLMFSAQTAASAELLAADLARGRVLYETTCDACHSANVHWRDKRIADSWQALLREVGRWQGNAGKRWNASEINDVAAYLNERFYHHPCPAAECAAKEAALHPR